MQLDTITETPPHVKPEYVHDFDIYQPPNVKTDFHLAWTALQAKGMPDIIWTPRNGGHWIPTRAAIINEVMSDYEHFSSSTIMIPKSLGSDHMLIPTTLDPPEHRPFRSLLNNNLARPVIVPMEDTIRETAIELIESFRNQGTCNFSRDYADIFPIRIFLSLMELPLEDTEQTKYWCDQLLRPDGTMTFAECMQKLFDYLEPYVDERRDGDGKDVLSRLVNGPIGDRQITKDEAMRLSVQLLIAGLDTVVNFLGFVMLHLGTHPQHQKELSAHPERIPDAVEEFLRRFPIVTIGREVVEDMEFHGVSLKAGEMIATPTPLGGSDMPESECPMDVDFSRKNKSHLTFGTGHHLCPGKDLARTEIRITLEEWIRRIPTFSVQAEKEVTFTGGIVAVVDGLSLNWEL
jgi:cytochrome P450